MRSLRPVVRWTRVMMVREWRQLSLIAVLVASAVAVGVTAVVGAYNLAPPPDAEYGKGAARAEVTGDAAAQREAFHEAFGTVGEIAAADVRLPGSVQSVQVRTVAEDDLMARPLVRVVDGAWPAGQQVALTGDLIRRFDAAVGDSIELAGRRLEVSGQIENPTDLRDQFALAASLGGLDVDPALVRTSFLIDAPLADIDAAAVGSLGVADPGEGLPEVRTMAAGAMLVLVVVVLIEVGLLAAAGFTILAQRRRRLYGLLAAAGATPRQIEFSGALVVFLAATVATGVGAAAAVLLVAAIVPGLEEAVNHRIDLALPVWGVVPTVVTAVLITTIAGWHPARQVALEDVAASLSLRAAPVDPSSAMGRWWRLLLAAGVALVAVGVGARLVVFAGLGVVIVGGVMIGLAGPLLHGVASVARRMPLWFRLASIRIDRQRSRSSAIVAAITLTLAVAVATASVVAGLTDPSRSPANLPGNMALVTPDRVVGDPLAVPAELDTAELEAIRADLVSQVPDAEVLEVRMAIAADATAAPAELSRSGPGTAITPALLVRPATEADDEVIGFGETDPSGEPITYRADRLWVATPELAQALGLNERVDPDDVAITTPWSDALTTIELDAPDLDITHLVDDELPTETSLARGYLTPAAAEEAGLETLTVGWLVVDDGSLTASERLRIESRLDGAAIAEFAEPRHRQLGVQLAAVAIASIMALIAVTATMGLVRVESAREESLFAAIGASPRMLRLSAAAGAVLLTGAALMVGIPLGFLGQWTIRAAAGSTSMSVPVVPIAALGAALPVLAGGIAAMPTPPGPGVSR